MAIKFLQKLDLQGNEIQNFKVHVASTDSGFVNDGEGSLWLDSSNNTLKFQIGNGTWKDVLDNTDASVRTITAGGNTLATSETLAFTQGTGITISENAGAVTITNSAPNTWRGVTAGGNTLASNETLAFTEGSNITISEDGGAVTITSSYTNTDTTYSAGSLLDLSTTTFHVDLTELTDMTEDWVTANDEFVVIDNTGNAQKRKRSAEIFGSNAFNSTTIGTTTNALTVDNTTIKLNSTNTFTGATARTISAKTAAIADAGTGLATADQIHTFVTTQTDEIDASTAGNAATATKIASITNSNIVQLAGNQTLTGTKTLNSFKGTGSVTVTNILDSDTMSGASATTLATSESIKAYADSLDLDDVSNANLLTRLAALESTSGATNENIVIGTDSGDTIVITGNLQVEGTTTTVNSTEITLDDHNIILDSNNSTAAVVNGAGITLDGNGTDVTWMWSTTGPKMELKLGAEYADAKFGTVTGTFVGNITGNVTGNTSGSSGSCTGNAATATALATARTIGGTSFNGTSNITPANATLAAKVTVTDNNGSTARPVVFHDGSNALLDDTGTFTYKPSTGTLTAPAFAGALTGNVTGNVTGSAATVTGAAQTAITSVGTLTDLTVSGASTTIGTVTSGVWNAGAVTSSGVVTATGFTIGNAVIGEAELEILDGANVSTTELNLLDGITAVANTYAPVVLVLNASLDGVALTDQTYALTHNFGTRNVSVKLYETGDDYVEVFAEVQHATTNTVDIIFGSAPTVGAYTAHITRN